MESVEDGEDGPSEREMGDFHPAFLWRTPKRVFCSLSRTDPRYGLDTQKDQDTNRGLPGAPLKKVPLSLVIWIGEGVSPNCILQPNREHACRPFNSLMKLVLKATLEGELRFHGSFRGCKEGFFRIIGFRWVSFGFLWHPSVPQHVFLRWSLALQQRHLFVCTQALC